MKFLYFYFWDLIYFRMNQITKVFNEYIANPLPELVEMYSNGSVNSRKLLRIIYKEFYSLIESHLRRDFKRSFYIDDIS